MRGRPVTDSVAWPIPSISGAHAHYAYNSIPRKRVHMYRMRIANVLHRTLVPFIIIDIVLVVAQSRMDMVTRYTH